MFNRNEESHQLEDFKEISIKIKAPSFDEEFFQETVDKRIMLVDGYSIDDDRAVILKIKFPVKNEKEIVNKLKDTKYITEVDNKITPFGEKMKQSISVSIECIGYIGFKKLDDRILVVSGCSAVPLSTTSINIPENKKDQKEIMDKLMAHENIVKVNGVTTAAGRKYYKNFYESIPKGAILKLHVLNNKERQEKKKQLKSSSMSCRIL